MLQRQSPASQRQARLERQLGSAPPTLAAAVVALTCAFEPPEFRLTEQEQAAAETQLRCVAAARVAFRGQADDDDGCRLGSHVREPVGASRWDDRAAAIREAAVTFDQAARRLRQTGLKLVVVSAGSGRAEMTYRHASNRRPTP